MVAISPSKRERDMVKERKEMIAVVRFQHGDEVMRQKYQKLVEFQAHINPNIFKDEFGVRGALVNLD